MWDFSRYEQMRDEGATPEQVYRVALTEHPGDRGKVLRVAALRYVFGMTLKQAVDLAHLFEQPEEPPPPKPEPSFFERLWGRRNQASHQDWKAIRKRFEELIALLPADTPEFVYDDYQYAEYETAFAAICNWLNENKIAISPDVFTRLEDLGTQLHIENRLMWEILRPQVK